MERRLAAIMATDVVGFAGLVAQDETGTLEQVDRLRREVIVMQVQASRGRLFKSMGDGFLAEFSSTLEAVNCAVGIQRLMAGRPLQLRIGVSVGDVVVQGDDLLGSGVNAAARLEAMAEAGGIAVSSEVMAQVRGKVDVPLEDAGYKKLKAGDEPLHVYMTRSKPGQSGGFMDLDADAVDRSLVKGGCLCGAIRFEISAPPLSAGYCHCRICQKFTGSPMSAWTAFPLSALRFVNGEPRYYASSPIAQRGFCPTCGSGLVYRMIRPEPAAHVVIFTGSLDEAPNYAPTAHNGMESRLPWMETLDDLPRTRSQDSRVLQEAWTSVGLPDPETWGPNAKAKDVF